jgi:hypothetical protein
MPWLQHVFAIWVLAHMVWAAVLLEKEWRRMCRLAGSADQPEMWNAPSALIHAEAQQVSTRQ